MKKSLVLSVLIICSIIYDASSQLTFEKNEYASRREKLMEMIPDGIAIIRGASEPLGNYHFRQYNNMMYFAGVEIPDVILIIDGANKKSTLFFTIDERLAESQNIPLSLVRDPVSITGVENYMPYEAFSGFVFACDIMAKTDDVTGIRIEDTVVITGEGCEILSSGLPRTVEEIEAFMKKN